MCELKDGRLCRCLWTLQLYFATESFTRNSFCALRSAENFNESQRCQLLSDGVAIERKTVQLQQLLSGMFVTSEMQFMAECR